MKTSMIALGVALATCAAVVQAEAPKEPVPVWDLAKDAFAATTGRIERVGGRVQMDGNSAFVIPNRAIPDASCFTISMEIRFSNIEPRDYLVLLEQRLTAITGATSSVT